MKHLTFRFSELLSVGYDIDKQLLEMYFRSGARYLYSNVPSTTYFSLLNAYSPDRYFEHYIKPIFDFTEIARRLSNKDDQTA